MKQDRGRLLLNANPEIGGTLRAGGLGARPGNFGHVLPPRNLINVDTRTGGDRARGLRATCEGWGSGRERW